MLTGCTRPERGRLADTAPYPPSPGHETAAVSWYALPSRSQRAVNNRNNRHVICDTTQENQGGNVHDCTRRPLSAGARSLLRSYLNPHNHLRGGRSAHPEDDTARPACPSKGRSSAHGPARPVTRAVCQGPRPQAPAALCEGAAARKVPRGVQARAPGSGCLPGVSATARPAHIPARPSTAPRAGREWTGTRSPYTPHATRRPRGRPRRGASHWAGKQGSRGPSLTFGPWALTSRFSRPLHPGAGGSRKRSRSSLKPGTVTSGVPAGSPRPPTGASAPNRAHRVCRMDPQICILSVIKYALVFFPDFPLKPLPN